MDLLTEATVGDASDPWRDQLDEFSEAITQVLLGRMEPWVDAEELEEHQGALAEFDHDTLIEEILSLINDIEEWYVDQHNELVSNVAEEGDLEPDQWLLEQDEGGWIVEAVQHKIERFSSALERFIEVAEALVEFMNDNSGINAFLKGAADPVDGIKTFFGQGSANFEGRRLDAKHNSACKSMVKAADALTEAIDKAVVTRWNTETVGALSEIEAAVP